MRTIPAACAFTAAVSLLVLPAAAPAFATDGTYTVPLHQSLPLTATSNGVEHESDCPVPAGEDGWHFVLPGNTTDFVKLTVTFNPGGTQVLTSFGPPSDKHAYVGSPAGAELVSASAEVKGGDVDWFNLSHTCPATSSSGSPSSSPSSSPSGGASSSPSESASSSPSPSPSASDSGSATASPSASSSDSSSAAASASASASPSGSGGGLAETGAQVGGIATAAALLVGAGTALVLRRRKAAGRH